MILVFNNLRVYHEEWETNPKLLESSIIISFGSLYHPRENYTFYDSHILTRYDLNDDEYINYLEDPTQYELIKERALLAIFMCMGFNLVFLTNKTSSLYDRLYYLLDNIRKRYGITSRYIEDKEDLPEVPREYDYFNIFANNGLDEDLAVLQQECNMKESDIRKMFETQIKRIESEI